MNMQLMMARARMNHLPSGGGDPLWSYVTEGLHLIGPNASTVFTDEKANSWYASGSSQITSLESRFGGGSLYNSTSSSQVVRTTTGGPALDNVGSYTIESWVKIPTFSSSRKILYSQTQNNIANFAGVALGVNNGKLYLYCRPSSGAPSTVLTSTVSTTTGVWTHLEMGVDTGTAYGFIDGTLVVSGAFPKLTETPTAASIGGWANGFNNEVLIAYYNDLRVTSGVARHTANFTPPTAPFPNHA